MISEPKITVISNNEKNQFIKFKCPCCKSALQIPWSYSDDSRTLKLIGIEQEVNINEMDEV